MQILRVDRLRCPRRQTQAGRHDSTAGPVCRCSAGVARLVCGVTAVNTAPARPASEAPPSTLPPPSLPGLPLAVGFHPTDYTLGRTMGTKRLLFTPSTPLCSSTFSGAAVCVGRQATAACGYRGRSTLPVPACHVPMGKKHGSSALLSMVDSGAQSTFFLFSAAWSFAASYRGFFPLAVGTRRLLYQS